MSFHIEFPLTSNPRGLLRCSGDSSGCRLVWAHSVMKDRVSALYRMWYSGKVHIPAPNEYRALNTQDVYRLIEVYQRDSWPLAQHQPQTPFGLVSCWIQFNNASTLTMNKSSKDRSEELKGFSLIGL